MARYRPDIDGLRAVAILSVVAYHAGIPGFSGGFVGVDVFFVLSGFLITQLLEAERTQTGRISFSQFYARRVRRLWPALISMVIPIVSLWLIFLPGLGNTRDFAASLRFTMLGIANLFFDRNSGGYFAAPTAEMPFLHLWSLAVEEQFYLFWPLILRLTRRLTLPALILGVTASLISAQWAIVHGHASWAFYWMPNRVWELGVGAWLALVLPSVKECFRSSRLGLLLASLGLVLITGSVNQYSAQTDFPGVHAILPVLGTLLLILTGTFAPQNLISRALSLRGFVRIGVLSYAWYLWHWPLLALLKVRNLGRPVDLGVSLGAVGLALLLAELSLRFIETPIREQRLWPKVSPRRWIAAGIAVNLIFVAVSIGVGPIENQRLIARWGKPFVDQINARSVASSSCPTISTVDSLIVWGDSHAAVYFSAIDAFACAHRKRAALYEQDDTAPFWDAENGNKILKVLSAHPAGVILVARWTKYVDPGGTEFNRRLRETIAQLTSSGVERVLIILPFPEFDLTPLRCGERLPERCHRSRAEVESHRQSAVEAIRAMSVTFPNVRVFDPVPVICTPKVCAQVQQGQPVTFDDNHPSQWSVHLLSQYLECNLSWLSGEKNTPCQSKPTP